MIDPEIDHSRIVSGDAAALTGAADVLADVGHALDDARGRIHDAAATTDWSGPVAVGFQARITQLANGVSVNRSAVALLLDAAADSLRSGSKAVALVSDHLMDSARDYQRTDGVVGSAFNGLTP